jgi:hypothetical protein
VSASQERGAWYRHPMLWLGGLVLLASIAGCLWLIAMAARYPDPPIDTGSRHNFRVPLEGPARPAAAPR